MRISRFYLIYSFLAISAFIAYRFTDIEVAQSFARAVGLFFALPLIAFHESREKKIAIIGFIIKIFLFFSFLAFLHQLLFGEFANTVLLILSSLSTALALLISTRINPNCILTLSTLALVISFYLIFSGRLMYALTSDEIVYGSRNQLINTVIFLYSIGYISAVQRWANPILSRLFSIMSMILFLAISTFAGRVTLVVSLLLFAHSFMLYCYDIDPKRLRLKEKFIRYFLSLLFLSPFAFFLFGRLESFYNSVISSKSYLKLVERDHFLDPRWDIFNRWLSDLNNLDYLFGYPFDHWDKVTGLTAHNSYIYFYSFFGLIGLLALMVCLCQSFVFFYRNNKLTCFLLTVMAYRMFFDSCIVSPDFATALLMLLVIPNSRIANSIDTASFISSSPRVY